MFIETDHYAVHLNDELKNPIGGYVATVGYPLPNRGDTLVHRDISYKVISKRFVPEHNYVSMTCRKL